jgi:hypothetical protein
MKYSKTIEGRIAIRIAREQSPVLLREDFDDLGGFRPWRKGHWIGSVLRQDLPRRQGIIRRGAPPKYQPAG